jgi:hypothetical protein
MSEMQQLGNSTLTDALAGCSVMQIIRQKAGQKRPPPGVN